MNNETETNLEHGSGLCFWIVNWVTDDSTALIEFDTDFSGTGVTVTVLS